MFQNINAIREAANNKETSSVPFWFSEDTMSFFNTRVLDEVFNMGEFGTLFVTADRPDTDVPEGFAVRWAHMKDGLFHITTLGDIMAYDSIGEAWQAAEAMSNAIPDVIRFTR